MVACVVAAAPASADVSAQDAKRARKLFDDGRKQIAAEHVDAACELFATSLALDPQLGTRLNLASCREQQGRYIDAYTLYQDAAAEAARTGKASRADFARKQIDALVARLVRVRIQITNPAGTTATLGGAAIDPAQLQLVKPGTIVVEVTAEGRQPFHIEKLAAAGSELTIDVPALAPIGGGGDTVEPATTGTTGTAALTGGTAGADSGARRGHHGRGIGYIVVGGIGVALAGASLGVALHARSRYHDAFDAGDRDGVSSAQREADIATGIAIGSGVAIGVAIVLFVRGGSGSGSTDHVTVVPRIGADGVGVAITGPL